MQHDDREKVRRVLEAALKKLNEESHGGELASDVSDLLIERLQASGSPNPDSPIILVVVGDLDVASQNPTASRTREVDKAKQPANLKSSDNCETKLSHSGLERLTMLKSDAHPAAPKMCFIEPARECVNSGACEMRGF